MRQNRVPVPADVLEGLEAVRTSGKTNMLDVLAVVKLALDMGFPGTALWVREHQALYAVGLFRRFEPTESLNEETLQDMAARFLDDKGGDA